MTSHTTAAMADAPAADVTAPVPAHPMMPSSSAASSSSNLSVPMWSAESSRRSSANSFESAAMAISASADGLVNPAKPVLPQPSSHTAPKTDPLARTYPKPQNEINVHEALQREPLRWTLGYWAKNAREQQAAPAPSAAAAAAAFEQKKQELRRAQQDLAQATQRRR